MFTKTETKPNKDDNKRETKPVSLMGSYFKQTKNIYSIGDIAEGEVIAIGRSEIYLDLTPYGTGIIYGREFLAAKDVLRKVQIGDKISAQVISSKNADGYIELSLKEARKAFVWSEAEKARRENKVFEITPEEANRGGLIIKWQGLTGFLPASQLTESNYPKVANGNKDAIISELQNLVDKPLSVTIITADPVEEKLIFSEKRGDIHTSAAQEAEAKFEVGDIRVGTVIGVVDFGIFLRIGNKVEGLVHISEISWGLVKDPQKIYAIGMKVPVKIMEIKNGKLSLSIKALEENPWLKATERYKQDEVVSGVIIKHSEYGALASIEEGIAGLVHISNFKNEEDIREKLELGRSYEFVITVFNPQEQKMSLVPKEIYKEKKMKEEAKEKQAEEK
ncbi:MAG: S1 RNA-binding domain-containing protein [Candidatus Campbellbacteria bacterium]|nr:S1 RNA-binding domain-containing protein [Candidatus Campbellbacteria bacterium]